jgi:hypothetical protein
LAREATGEQNRLRAIGRAQFSRYLSHVRFDRGLRDLQIFSDLLVEETGAQHAENPELLRCEVRHPLGDLQRIAVCAGVF